MKQRILTALVGIPIVLGVCFCTHPVPIAVLLLLVYFFAADELRRIAGVRHGPMGVFALALSIASVWQTGSLVLLPLLWIMGVFAATWCIRDLAILKKRFLSMIATLWLATPLVGLFYIHQRDFEPRFSSPWVFENPLLIVLIILWVGDSAAYFVGKAIGRHLLAPTISPKKTWEGAIANLVSCALAGILISPYIPRCTLTEGLALGLVAGVLGQTGDLFESWLKRQANVKDSGTLLPGHGGVLDRIDSLLFTAIPSAFILMYWPR